MSPGNPFSNRLFAYINGEKPQESHYDRPILHGEAGNLLVKETIMRDKPCLVTRLGGVELRCVNYFTRASWLRKVGVPYPRSVRREMRLNAGFFPTTGPQLDRFASAYLDSMSQTDVMALWFTNNEHRYVHQYCPAASLIVASSLEAMRFRAPWSAALAGKVVLVVHPFARSIESQYRTQRRSLFANPDVLPEFELKTIRAVQSIAGNTEGYATWFEAFKHMCDRISVEDFDIAIVGAGAYGLPLAAFVKSLGKTAVHMGGATQILFGIIGRRWEIGYRETLGTFINEHWVRPLPEETPSQAQVVEDGAYW